MNRECMRIKFLGLFQTWLTRFDVSLADHRITSRRDPDGETRTEGRANPEERTIELRYPRPVTRTWLYVAAHEIGHVALGHDGSNPVYVEEYEAEQFARALFREAGLEVPKGMARNGPYYVTYRMQQDPSIHTHRALGLRPSIDHNANAFSAFPYPDEFRPLGLTDDLPQRIEAVLA